MIHLCMCRKHQFPFPDQCGKPSTQWLQSYNYYGTRALNWATMIESITNEHMVCYWCRMQSVYQQQLRRHTNATQCQVTAPHTRHKKSIIESRTLNWLRPNFKRSRAATPAPHTRVMGGHLQRILQLRSWLDHCLFFFTRPQSAYICVSW
jgi:hypothetical protein